MKEEGDLNVEDAGDFLKAAGADAVRSFLVFLNLLKAHAELIAKAFLTKAEREPTRANAPTDMLVDAIRPPDRRYGRPPFVYRCYDGMND